MFSYIGGNENLPTKSFMSTMPIVNSNPTSSASMMAICKLISSVISISLTLFEPNVIRKMLTHMSAMPVNTQEFGF